jgi:hypothetical protein
VFSVIHQLADNIETIRRITAEVIEDFASENVVYLELRTTPKNNPLTKMSKEEYNLTPFPSLPLSLSLFNTIFQFEI